MADPVIDQIIAPPSFTPGQAFDVKIVAHDPDAMIRTFTGHVTDEGGNEATVTIQIPEQDPLVYALDGFGTITQDATDPSLFHVQT